MVIGIDAARANVRERTGTERYAYEIIRRMIVAHPEQRFRLYAESPPQPDFRDLGSNVEWRTLRWPPRYLWSQLRLAVELFINPVDTLFIPAHTIPLVHPRKTVVTIHDLGFERLPELYGDRPIGGRGARGVFSNVLARLITLGRYGGSELDYHRWSARFSAQHAHRIIAVSEFTKTEIVRLYRADSGKISVVHHGLNTDVFRRADPKTIEEVQRRFGLHRPYLLYTGRLEQKKNIDGMIETFRLARSASPSLQLVLLGAPGLGWEATQARLDRNPIRQTIHVLGWQPDDIYRPLLSGAAAFLMLSRYEGFGMPILEAFAVGTPVIAARTASLPEVVGPAGRLVDLDHPQDAANAINEIIKNESERQRLIHLGHERVSQFSWDRAAQATYDLLRSARSTA